MVENMKLRVKFCDDYSDDVNPYFIETWDLENKEEVVYAYHAFGNGLFDEIRFEPASDKARDSIICILDAGGYIKQHKPKTNARLYCAGDICYGAKEAFIFIDPKNSE